MVRLLGALGTNKGLLLRVLVQVSAKVGQVVDQRETVGSGGPRPHVLI